MLDEARKLDADGGDFIEFATAGSAAAGEYHCSVCGYGITVHTSLPQCPMCASTTWEPAAWSVFAGRDLQSPQ
jgi:rubrerythrin